MDGETTATNEGRAALEERLREARERRRAAEAKREERQAENDLLAEVEAEELAARNAEALEAAEAEHGPIGKKLRAIETSGGVIIVKRPHPATYKRFRDKGEANTAAFDKLVRPCVVHPDKSTFDRILDEEPAALDRCANAIVELAGFRAREVSGK